MRREMIGDSGMLPNKPLLQMPRTLRAAALAQRFAAAPAGAASCASLIICVRVGGDLTFGSVIR